MDVPCFIRLQHVKCLGYIALKKNNQIMEGELGEMQKDMVVTKTISWDKQSPRQD
jgi:hypothetical protein